MLKAVISRSGQAKIMKQLYRRGNLFLANGRPELAVKHYQKYLAFYHQGWEAEPVVVADIYHNLGMIAEERQAIDEAIAYYEQALKYDAYHGMTWIFLAKLYLNRYEEQHRQSDRMMGVKALEEAERCKTGFPAVNFLKKRYAIA
ncbi:MAG TPA: tetratricopeptide repeat protein [Bacillota bacterium]|nr:tetratricopeptide repeat protein [Bacillota bacterium]HPT87383.1 tetratricopeptide repeat protein [Bacillota bacterium]